MSDGHRRFAANPSCAGFHAPAMTAYDCRVRRIAAPPGRSSRKIVPSPSGVPMPSITGKRAFLQLLKQEGVEILFGNPGTTELPLMDALAVESELRYVLGLQEAAVLAMADGYAQASGKLA